MKLVIQRVRRARVLINDQEVSSIQKGAMILCGVARGDTPHDIEYLAKKTSLLRIFDDPQGKMNLSISEVGGSFLVVSQFTLYGDSAKGNRPSYIEAAQAEEGRQGYEEFVRQLRELGHRVEEGRFREHMIVDLENDGPVTLILESRGRGAA